MDGEGCQDIDECANGNTLLWFIQMQSKGCYWDLKYYLCSECLESYKKLHCIGNIRIRPFWRKKIKKFEQELHRKVERYFGSLEHGIFKKDIFEFLNT